MTAVSSLRSRPVQRYRRPRRGGEGTRNGLLILGQATVKTIPAAEHELKVFLFESGASGAKGISDQKIGFSFLGNAGSSQLDNPLVTTDKDGRGTVRLTVGPSFKGTFQVQAVAGAYSDVKPVYFSFDIKGLGRTLKIVGDQEKNVWTKQKVTLTVKLAQVDYTKPKSPEQPVQGEEVTFKIVKDAVDDPRDSRQRRRHTLRPRFGTGGLPGRRSGHVNAAVAGEFGRHRLVNDRGTGPIGCYEQSATRGCSAWQ